MNNPRAPIAACALLALTAGTAAGATESGYERSEAAPTCLRLNKIRSTQVIDRKHILFTLTNGETFVNKLPNACPGLRVNGSWVNRVHYPEICDLGLIVPLTKIGTSLIPMGNCALGKFEWVAKPDVEALRAELQEGQQERGILEPADANAVQEAEPEPIVTEEESAP